MDVGSALEEFIVKELMVSDGDVKLEPDKSLLAGGVIDSLGILRLVTFIEEQFGVTIDDVDVVPENFETINAMKALIASKGQ